MDTIDSDRPVFILVHGAWHGGWCWRRVADRLRARGYRVFTPTLSGLGEHSHLLHSGINLTTHINDIVNLARWEDLDNIILCGHSYAGMVIAGAADVLAPKLRALVYLDAFVPEADQAACDIGGDVSAKFLESLFSSPEREFLVPPPAAAFGLSGPDCALVDGKCTLHPFATYQEKLPSSGQRDTVQRKIYVFAARFNSPILRPTFEKHLKEPDWEVSELDVGHEMMLEAPDETAQILLSAARPLRDG